MPDRELLYAAPGDTTARDAGTKPVRTIFGHGQYTLKRCNKSVRAFNRFRIRMKRSANRAAVKAPATLYNAASKSQHRSGVRACKASNSIAALMRIPPTTNGRRHARQNITVK